MISQFHLAFDTINILVLIAGILSYIYGFIVLGRDRSLPTNQAFAAFSFAVATWSISMAVFRSPNGSQIETFAASILYLSAVLIPPTFITFVKLFESDTYPNLRWYVISMLPCIIMAVISVVPGMLITGVTQRAGSEPVIHFNWYLHLLYFFYILFYGFVGYVILIRRYIAADTEKRNRIFYIMAGAFVPLTFSAVTNLLLPFIGIFDFNWVGQVSTFVMVSIITYGIFRHKIFNIRIIAAELLMLIMWGIAFVQVLMSQGSVDLMFNMSSFVALLAVGVMLVRSVMREVEQREEAEMVSKERSELMVFATHELRNPVTAMRGYASLILDPTMTLDAGPQTKEIVQNIYSGSNDMLRLISQFLNKSKLELGQIEYMFTTFDVGATLSPIVDSFKPVAAQKNIQVINKIDLSQKFMIRADETKLRENVGDLIDNAIKYTKEGNVTVSIERHGVQIRIIVADTGVGIPPETMPHLFKKFSRADAKKANLLGTGVGLYLAKTLIEGSGGHIWAESEGDGKGSRFIVEFPAA